ncbi:MAG: phosphate transporter periplasmic phosphate-binding protein [Massilia sp.]|jgi:phosphate transport system substrate-binding protein|nr:phosphate transporter periplasmic phosphate-binding protein [Massilia sp.]
MKNTPIRLAALLPAIFSVAASMSASHVHAQERDSLEVQRGRDDKLIKRGSKVYYTEQFDMSGLPLYKPERQVSGTIREWGSNYFQHGSLGKLWEEGFRKYQPEIKFEYHLETTGAAIPALSFGLADIGPSRHITSNEVLLFQRYHNSKPLEIPVVTGSLNVPGWSYAIGIFVHKDNPITKLTVEQLDGIFGAERDGAFQDITWNTSVARGPEKNIRTWGQLGLTGEWADKPIQVHGYNLRYNIPRTFERHVFQDGAKWNEKLHEYTNYKNKDGTTELEAMQTQTAVSNDKYAIGYSSVAFVTPQTKAVAVAPRGSKEYVELNLKNLQSRKYPLYDEVYFYLKREPGKPLDPKVREFVRYVLSREGQEAVARDGKYLPLPAATVRELLKKLD